MYVYFLARAHPTFAYLFLFHIFIVIFLIFCIAPPRPYLIYVIPWFGLFMVSMSLPFSSILHRIFHHLLLFAFLPPCAHFMYILARACQPMVYSTVHSVPSCFVVVNLQRSLRFHIFTYFHIWHLFVHKRFGYLPQTRPRADCCTSRELVPALLQPYVGRFSFAFASRHTRLALFLVAFRPDHVRTAARLTRGSFFLPSFLSH
jgi:hypothetical protein